MNNIHSAEVRGLIHQAYAEGRADEFEEWSTHGHVVRISIWLASVIGAAVIGYVLGVVA